jgi:putative aminopeptidase FrvX
MTRLKIDTDYLADALRQMLDIPSPTGYTDTVVRHVSKELSRLGLEPSLTRRGAIRSIRQGRKAHGRWLAISIPLAPR